MIKSNMYASRFDPSRIGPHLSWGDARQQSPCVSFLLLSAVASGAAILGYALRISSWQSTWYCPRMVAERGVFHRSECPYHSWKYEQIVHPKNRESFVSQKLPGFDGRHRYSVLIIYVTVHHVTSAGIPGIVLPKGKIPPSRSDW